VNVRSGLSYTLGGVNAWCDAGTRLLSPPHQALRLLLFGFTNFSPAFRRSLSSAFARRLVFRFIVSIRSRLRQPLPRGPVWDRVCLERCLDRTMQQALEPINAVRLELAQVVDPE
jgi:hypothetical protein